MKLRIVNLLMASILTGCFIAPVLAQTTERVIVLGCENRIKDKKWKDYRISFGVTSLIAQYLYDWGKFSLVEEKQEIRDKLRGISETLWNKGQKGAVPEAHGLFDSTSLAIGRLVYCGAPRTNVSVGPMHASRNEIIIKVEVDLVRGHTVFTGKGQGSASRTGMSTLLEFRENAVLFDQTAIGLALKNAVEKAVDDLVVNAFREK